MERQINYSGLVVALVGFVLTRFTVTLALYDEPLRFYLAGVLPLALGLGLAAFGVALTVADVERSVVRTTAIWCVVGVLTMALLVGLTLLGSAAGAMSEVVSLRSRASLSNFLIGGTLTGLYASRVHRQRRDLRAQANRLSILNRVLRHEVLNAVTAIRGYAELDDDHAGSREVIVRRANGIESTIEEVKYLARGTGTSAVRTERVDLAECLTASVDAVRERHPAVDITLDGVDEGIEVRANDRLSLVFTHLLTNAAVHAGTDDATVAVAVSGGRRGVSVSVRDEGAGLPESQRALLETGDIEEYDDPNTGFGLNVVRLLVEDFDGEITTTVDGGTTVTVVLPRADDGASGPRFTRSAVTAVGTPLPDLTVILGAALAAGVLYGVVSEALGGSIAGIGVFYGTADPVVGWITHQFHSVVFGFVFVALVSLVPSEHRDLLRTHVAVGFGWSLALWVGAAGIVAPVWLRLIGIPAPLPALSADLLVSHLVWGGSLGLLTALGYAHVRPWVRRVAQTH